MATDRRGFIGAIVAAVVAFIGGVATSAAAGWYKPRSVFAEHVRLTHRRLNRNGKEHAERGMMASMPYKALEDPRAFHQIAEHIRLNMIESLREHGAPINVWRVGTMDGLVASRIDARTGGEIPWKDEHYLYVRTRVSVENPPFQSEE